MLSNIDWKSKLGVLLSGFKLLISTTTPLLLPENGTIIMFPELTIPSKKVSSPK
jgi:hypothetical protein